MIRIHKERDEITAKKKAGEALSDLLKRCQEKPILLMLSGGSGKGILDFVDTESLGENVTISVLDERLSKGPKVNNFAKLTQSVFYKKAQGKRTSFIDTQVKAEETLEGLRLTFEDELRSWRKRNPKGKTTITQGIGEDGHTAGIMPYPEDKELFKKLFDQAHRWVVGYDADGKSQYPLRVTVTLPFLKEKVDHSIVCVVGDNKRGSLEKVLAKRGTLWETPGRIIDEMKDVQIFTDIGMGKFAFSRGEKT